MKLLKITILTICLTSILSSCCTCDDDCSIDLSHYYEPHVAALHYPDDSSKHYYSVMMVVKKGQNIYEVENQMRNREYNVEFSFDEDGASPMQAISCFAINKDYELRLYKYEVPSATSEATARSSCLDEGTPFNIFVRKPPIGHPHEHEHGEKLHRGTIHRPNTITGRAFCDTLQSKNL